MHTLLARVITFDLFFLMRFLLNWSPGVPANACKDGHIFGDAILQPASPQAGF